MSVYNGHDLAFNSFGGELNCLYYYFLNKETQNDSSYLGFVSTIQTVSYNPFIEMNDLSLVKSYFNTDKYGTPVGASSTPSVYRISDNINIDKTLYTQNVDLTVSNEPILNYYPYRYLMLYDGFNQPLIIKPQYLKTKKVEI